MGNTLGCWGGTKNLKELVAEETTSVDNNTSPNEIVNLVVESFPELPEELVVEILSKLPVQTLLRFKTVCKPWKLLTESPLFIDIHLRRRNPEIEAVYTYEQHHPTENSFQENGHSLSSFPVPKGNIVGTCNGIVCLQPSLPEKRLFLFNPSTREYSFTPDEFHGKYNGFCYLSKTNEYKIVSFGPQLESNKVDMMIMTLGKTISLRHVKDVTIPGCISEVRKSTSGTKFFWLGFDFVYNEIVISYDAIEERFSKMNLPHTPYISYRSLSVLNDSVMMFTYPMIHTTFFDIWILVDDASKGMSWSKYRKIGPLETYTLMKPIGIGWFGRSILCFDYTYDNEYRSSNLFYYNLETDEVEYHAVDDSPILEIANYAESLASIKSLGLDTTYYY